MKITNKHDGGNGVLWFDCNNISYGMTDDGRLLDEDGIPTDETASESLAVIEAFEEDDFPENLKAILDEHGVAMQVGHSGETEWYSVDEVGTEFEEAKEAIAHDLHSCHFMPHGEAQEWADNYSRHQALEVRKAIRKLLS